MARADDRERVQVRHHGASRLGDEAWFVSVLASDGTWTFVAEYNCVEAADSAAEVLHDAIAAALTDRRASSGGTDAKVFCDGCGDELETVDANGVTRVLICQACVERDV